MKLLLPVAIGLVLAACGDDSGAKTHDGGTIDAIDAPPPTIDAPALPVSVTLISGGAGASGATVYFQNADSTLVAELTTDGSGSASHLLDAGGFVTVLVPQVEPSVVAAGTTFAPVAIDTFADVQPGDNLVVTTDPPITSQTVGVTAGLAAGANAYKLFTSCNDSSIGIGMTIGASAVTATISVPADCATADLAVWASGTGGFLRLAYKAAVPMSAAIDLTATAYAAPLTVAMTFTDVPANVGVIFGNQTFVSTPSELFGPQSLDQAVTAGSAAGMLSEPDLTGTNAHMLTITEPDFGGNANGNEDIYELAPIASSYAIDVGAHVLRLYESQPAFSMTTHAVTWTEAATGLASDFTLAELDITRSPNSWAWTVAAPHATPSIAFPTLPTDIFNYNPTGTDEVETGDLDSFKVPGGYDAVRAHAFDDAISPALLGTAGTAVSESRQFQVATLRARHRRHRQLRP